MGQDRLVCPWIGCGKCARCLEGMDNHCMAPRWIGIQRPGGYADHLLVPHAKYLVDASGIDAMWLSPIACRRSLVSSNASTRSREGSSSASMNASQNASSANADD